MAFGPRLLMRQQLPMYLMLIGSDAFHGLKLSGFFLILQVVWLNAWSSICRSGVSLL